MAEPYDAESYGGNSGEPYGIAHVDLERIALLTNPHAGKGRAGAAADIARSRFADHGIDVVSIQGADPEGARELAKEMVADPSIDALVVCGGDGLINLALQEQAESKTPLGIIPAGTGNDHAREYGIPTHPRRAADVIARGFCTTTDLGRMRVVSGSGSVPNSGLGAEEHGGHGDRMRREDAGREHWFGTIACAGFDSLVSDRTNRILWPRGQMRYNVAIVAEFLNFHSLPTRLVLEPDTPEERVIEENMTLVAMGNTRSYGGGMYICPDADHHDGFLDITVLERMSRVKAALKFIKIFDGSFVEERGVSTHRVKKVRIEMRDRTGRHINGYADGDRFAPLPMEVEIVPGAGRYIVPRP